MAKFCTSCGAPLDDAVKFCTNCGAQNTAPQPAPVPVASAQPPTYAPQLPPAKKRLKPPVLIGAVAALVALIAIIAISAHKDGPGPSLGPKPPSGDAAAAMKALEGSWYYYDGWYTGHIWTFSADGRFAGLVASQVSYTNNVGTHWESAYRHLLKGKYRINGCVIECYDCQISSDFKMGVNPWAGTINLTASELINTPLSDPDKTDNFSMEFEFYDAMTLRLVCKRSALDRYDEEFEYYSGDSHDVTVPTFRIPAREWPEAFVKMGMPKYDDGRIRYAGNRMNGDKVSEVNVEIDFSTPAYLRATLTACFNPAGRLRMTGAIHPLMKKMGTSLVSACITGTARAAKLWCRAVSSILRFGRTGAAV